MDNMYKTLVNMPGVSTFERGIRKFVEKELEKYSDELIYDNLGGVFGVKKSKKADAPVIMVAGHMDEVGAMIVDVTKEGILKLTSMGGIIPEVMLSQHMEVIKDNGEIVPGVISTVPPHLLRGSSESSKLKFEDLMLDIGADDKAHVAKLGVKVGQQVVFKNYYTETADGKKVISKAWDDRWGVGMSIELLRDLKDVDLDVTLIAGATVQEEVGLRGGQVASQMVKPDMFIACDVSPANDFGLAKEKTMWGKLGGGTLLRFQDPSCVMHRGLREFYIETAEENNINYQMFQSMGGTDAAVAQLAGHGTLAMTIGVCARYIHSNTSMLHKADHESARQMLKAIVTKLSKENVDKIKKNV